MADEALLAKIQDLSDLELATLICLVAEEHCIIDTDPEVVDDLVRELELIAAKVFGLSCTLLDCSEQTTLDDVANAILVDNQTSHSTTSRPDYFASSPTFRSMSRSSIRENAAENQKIANLVLAKNLDRATQTIQIQALELMRTKRIFTRRNVQAAPKPFLFIAILAGGEGPRLTKHLNDYIFMSHYHDPEDGFPNIEETSSDSDSMSSVVKKSPGAYVEESELRIPASEIAGLARRSQAATASVEVRRYQHNIISFLRLHRAVGGGISALGTTYFEKLMRCLAPLHGLSYVTPSLVALAARKIYAHRIHITTPERERSMQYGSDLEAVRQLLDGVKAEDVVEDVLGSAGPDVPL